MRMSFAVTPDERAYLQFMFGLLDRVLASEALMRMPMMHHYGAIVTDVWQMERGSQTVEELAALHARACGAYVARVQQPYGDVRAGRLQEEAVRQQDGAPLSLEQYQALVFFDAFDTFFVMTLARGLGGTLGEADLRLLRASLFPSDEDRATFYALALAQCAAMCVAPAAMCDLLLRANDPAARPRDDHKVAVITCVNDEAVYAACRERLAALVLPEGFSIDLVPVRGATSMCAGYAEGMAATDAQFKMYLHQDMMLEKPDILLTLLPFFAQHPEVGMIGLAGSWRWHTSGIWWEQADSYLHLAHGTGAQRHAYTVGTMTGAWGTMAMLDGVFLMTQVDFPGLWRADLLRGWHFYDIAACAEMRRRGYALAIPRQDVPWFTHWGGDKDVDVIYHYWRGVFLEAYGKDMEAWQSRNI